MTNDRAIEVLKAWDLNYQDEFTAHEFDEAFRMAIKALEREQCEDAVSRQAVLDKKELVQLEDGQSFYCISPEDVETLPSVTSKPKYNTSEWCHDCKEYDNNRHCCPRFNNVIRKTVEEIKQSKTGHCKDCKYFEYDHFENMGGIPLITAHKVCKRHGLICKTDEDGYCHLWEHKAESEE